MYNDNSDSDKKFDFNRWGNVTLFIPHPKWRYQYFVFISKPTSDSIFVLLKRSNRHLHLKRVSTDSLNVSLAQKNFTRNNSDAENTWIILYKIATFCANITRPFYNPRRGLVHMVVFTGDQIGLYGKKERNLTAVRRSLNEKTNKGFTSEITLKL